jgi:hypothetical protein
MQHELQLLALDIRLALEHSAALEPNWADHSISLETAARVFNDPDAISVGWHLVRKTPVSNSTSKTWLEQQAILSKDEETPTARVMIYTMIGHYLATGERLFESIYVRCSDVDSGGLRVCVGGFGADGLRVSHDWDGYRYGVLGVSSARKPN